MNNGLEIPEMSSEAMELLTRLPYPGNIRELKNILERAVLTGGHRLERKDFEYLLPSQDSTISMNVSSNLDEIERNALKETLEKSNGNYTQAARSLGVTRQTLYRKLEKHGLK